jgi:Tfp pilus assembly protein FimT
MVVSVAILLILSAIAIPTLMRAYRSYLLSDATSRVAGIMKFTRFEAIRKNTPIGFQVKQSGTNWILWTDSNGNAVADQTEVQVVLTGTVTFLSSGVPSNAPIATALGGAAPALSVVSGSNQAISFDGRGAVKFPGSQAVYVFYLGNTSVPDMGARAVVLLPSGIVQTWTVGASSTWMRLS